MINSTYITSLEEQFVSHVEDLRLKSRQLKQTHYSGSCFVKRYSVCFATQIQCCTALRAVL